MRSFRQSIDEDVRGRVAVPILLMGIVTACTSFAMRLVGSVELWFFGTGITWSPHGNPPPQPSLMAWLLLVPLIPLMLFAAFGLAAMPVHLVARRVFGGHGRWCDTVQALAWAGLPTLALLLVSLGMESARLNRAATLAVDLIASLTLLLGACVFLGTAHRVPLHASVAAIGSGVLVVMGPALWMQRSEPPWGSTSLGVTFLLLTGAAALAGLVLGVLLVVVLRLRERA